MEESGWWVAGGVGGEGEEVISQMYLDVTQT